jgi:hypothetical protein
MVHSQQGKKPLKARQQATALLQFLIGELTMAYHKYLKQTV